MAQKFRQVNEAFDWVFEASSKDEQITRLKEVAKSNQTIVPLVRWGVGAEEVDWGLPDGMPEAAKIEDDVPDGMGETTIALEFRRIKQFVDPTANLKNLPDWKQEMNWLSIMEGLHHKEAMLMTQVKDKQLIAAYPKLEGILSKLGIEDYVKPKKTRATRKKKKQ
jgi:hypothetical protein